MVGVKSNQAELETVIDFVRFEGCPEKFKSI